MKEKFAKSDIYHLKGNKRYKVPGDEYGQYSNSGDMDTGFRHSRAYHSFFEGYSEVKVKKENGKEKIERVYTAPYISRFQSDKERIITVIIYWALTVTAIGLFLFCGLQRIESNQCVYVAAPGLLSAIAAFLLCVKLVSYSFSSGKMTIYEFKECTKGVKRYSAAAAVLLGACGISTAVFCILNDHVINDVINSILLIVAAACMAMIFIREKKIKYREIPNEMTAPEDSVMIR